MTLPTQILYGFLGLVGMFFIRQTLRIPMFLMFGVLAVVFIGLLLQVFITNPPRGEDDPKDPRILQYAMLILFSGISALTCLFVFHGL